MPFMLQSSCATRLLRADRKYGRSFVSFGARQRNIKAFNSSATCAAMSEDTLVAHKQDTLYRIYHFELKEMGAQIFKLARWVVETLISVYIGKKIAFERFHLHFVSCAAYVSSESNDNCFSGNMRVLDPRKKRSVAFTTSKQIDWASGSKLREAVRLVERSLSMYTAFLTLRLDVVASRHVAIRFKAFWQARKHSRLSALLCVFQKPKGSLRSSSA